MKKIEDVSQSTVWEHWQRVENFSHPNFRSDIRNPLPLDLKWSLAEIEDCDFNAFHIISSSDWTDISGGTFRVSVVVSRLRVESNSKDTIRLAKDILGKIDFLKCGGKLDEGLIAVTHNDALQGPFTLIEGNRRSVAFSDIGTLVGKRIFVGVSPGIANYCWAKKAMKYRILNE